MNKPTGKKHFDLSEEDRIAEILEHPLPLQYTTNTEEDGENYVTGVVKSSSVVQKHRKNSKHLLQGAEDRQKRARKHVMVTEYSRTICKSAERLQSRKNSASNNLAKTAGGDEAEALYAEAYGNLIAQAPRVQLTQAALSVPSFQNAFKKATNI